MITLELKVGDETIGVEIEESQFHTTLKAIEFLIDSLKIQYVRGLENKQ